MTFYIIVLIALSCTVRTSALIIAFYKPPLVLCNFSDDAERAIQKHRHRRTTLANLGLPEGLHAVGRLDRDSEGLLLLTDDGQFTQKVTTTTSKRYWALVKGVPSEAALDKIRAGGFNIRGVITRPPEGVRRLKIDEVTEMQLPSAVPGMDRVVGNTWLEIILNEGRNRQVRRITQDAGHPTMRLVRIGIGPLTIQAMKCKTATHLQSTSGERTTMNVPWEEIDCDQIFLEEARDEAES